MEASAECDHAPAHAHVLLATTALVGDGKLGIAEFLVAAKLGVVFDDDLEKGVGGTLRLEGFFRRVKYHRALRGFDVICLVNLLLAKLDVCSEVGVWREAVSA